METQPLASVQADLDAYVDAVATSHQRVTITRNGTPAAVIISADELESLEETLALLADPEAMASLREAEAEIARGEYSDAAEMAALLARRAR